MPTAVKISRCWKCHQIYDKLYKCTQCNNFFCSNHKDPWMHHCKKNEGDKKEPWGKKRPKPRSPRFIRKLKYPMKKYRYLLYLFSFLILMIIVKFTKIIPEGHLYSLSIMFYIAEIILISYVFFMLLKKIDSIYIGSNLRLFFFRALSGIVGASGFIIAYFIIFSPLITLGQVNTWNALMFGKEFGFQLTGIVILYMTILWTSITGSYMFFKFQRKTGTFHWIGRI